MLQDCEMKYTVRNKENSSKVGVMPIKGRMMDLSKLLSVCVDL